MENTRNRPYSCVVSKLKTAGLRPTKQRIALAKLLFEKECGCHITAENLHKEVMNHGLSISLATIYNTLNQFTEAKILKEIIVDPGLSYFDSNTMEHHHFYYEDSAKLEDIPVGNLAITNIPDAPAHTEISRIDVIVRLKEEKPTLKNNLMT
ncbi:MAG: iron response transcriptional regulator IrrA [Alphaproteobacteria bacterium]